MLSRIAATAWLVLAIPGIAPAQPQLQAMQDCSITASEGLTAAAEASSVGLAFAGDGSERHVIAATPRIARGVAVSTELRPVRRGVSYGATLAPATGGGAWEAAFTMAGVEEAGTVLLETWRWGPTDPSGSAPSYAWSRLRCGP